MTVFDPNGVGIRNGNFLGLPYTLEEAEIIIIPVPWDVTTSYRPGTARGPQAVIDASLQADLFDYFLPNAWENKIATLPIPEEISVLNHKLRPMAEEIIGMLEQGIPEDDLRLSPLLEKINAGSARVNAWVREQAENIIERGKIPVVLGGDHSTPLGLMQAIGVRHPGFGILHIDAHADLRQAYEGFTWSHASIMFNALQDAQPGKLVQVGIRDVCEAEIQLAAENTAIKQFDDFHLSLRKFAGEPFVDICHEIVESLPQRVYISFDIDGLSPDLCPHTGTPVPGGLSFMEAIQILHMLVHSGRQIVGFDLCEVAPGPEDEWDANVGARILQKLCNFTRLSSFNQG
ncbi:MAG: agmatinase [Bacteroidales bacterium]|jgi:agmatinase|nr:agmatinase [Bacteroidales bacterium]MDN5330000.1 agmatinase [Bacteroidales bacterium]